MPYDTVDSNDTRKVVDPMEGFLKNVDQNGNQVPSKATKG